MDRRKITSKTVYQVVAQPGDSTRYEFMVWNEGDLFFFVDRVDTIPYPKYLKWSEVQNFNTVSLDDDIIQMASFHSCNPWTLAECIRTMRAIKGCQVDEIGGRG